MIERNASQEDERNEENQQEQSSNREESNQEVRYHRNKFNRQRKDEVDKMRDRSKLPGAQSHEREAHEA